MISNRSVGIDISNQQVSIVCSRNYLKGHKVVASDRCLLAEDQELKTKTDDISNFINEFLNTHRLYAAEIYIAIPTENLIFREIELPTAVRENLAATIAYEMEKYVPLSAEAVYFDFQITSEDRERDRLTVALVLAKRSVLAPYLEIADRLNIPVSGLTPRGAGIAGAFLTHAAESTGRFMIICPTAAHVESVIIRNKSMIYAKTLPAGRDQSRAQQGRELAALKTHFQDESSEFTVKLLALQANDAVFQALSRSDEIGITDFVMPAIGLTDPDYIPAYGTSLQAFQKMPVKINLMPPHLRKKPNKVPYYIMYGLAGALVISGILLGGSHVAKQYAYLAHLDERVAALRAEANEIERIRSNVNQVEARINQLTYLRPGNAYVVNVLRELTRRIPLTAWVKDLNISGNKVIIYGTADSASELIPSLEASPMFQGVEFLSTIRKGRDNREVYRIGFKFNRTGQ